ncbi:type II toxin-antitoxin system RelE/ParE family toxin [Jiella marina]|uniref:type II toxin-antitoxin system RelE/ParE family toxin n=1 Tax=Jiella sp. LLJ827 TaxID=2917712 RepID=UPI002101A418|nr:type II toxin-antitoxin system RelE/ParE family toxin [Jiella sp. LLJ827]MCQ0990541.1 type II toxin-antitoxin system RelE/ParE family toxin [Jiella sp. LLJ827]
MKHWHVRLSDEAEDDLAHIYRFVRRKSASTTTARNYVGRIRAFLDGFDTFPERGTVRDNIRPGLRVVGFEHRVSVAFVVDAPDVIILRVLYAGQQFDSDDASARDSEP